MRRLVLGGSAVAVGLGMAMLLRTGTAVGSRLFMNEEMAHPDAVGVERLLAGLALVAAALVLARPTRAVGAAVLALMATVLAWAGMDQGGVPFSDWAIPASALRIAAPLGLLILTVRPTDRTANATDWLIRIACAVVFTVHGLEALRAHPWFVDLTIAAMANTFAPVPSQTTIEQLLVGVAVLDFAAAIGIMLRWRAAAWYMVLWGTFTALLRVLAYGEGAIGEMVVRLPHGLLPLMFLWVGRDTASPPESPQPDP